MKLRNVISTIIGWMVTVVLCLPVLPIAIIGVLTDVVVFAMALIIGIINPSEKTIDLFEGALVTVGKAPWLFITFMIRGLRDAVCKEGS